MIITDPKYSFSQFSPESIVSIIFATKIYSDVSKIQCKKHTSVESGIDTINPAISSYPSDNYEIQLNLSIFSLRRFDATRYLVFTDRFGHTSDAFSHIDPLDGQMDCVKS